MAGPQIKIPLQLSDSPSTAKLRKVLRERAYFPINCQSLVAEGIMFRLFVLSATQAVKARLKGMTIEDLGEVLGSHAAAAAAEEAGIVKVYKEGLLLWDLHSAVVSDPQTEATSTALAEEILREWNKLAKAKRLSSVLSMTPRLPVIQTRMRHDGFAQQWRKALKVIEKSGFHCGQNDRGWKASLDWFLGTKHGVPNWMRLLENEPNLPAVVTEEDDVPHYLRRIDD